MFSGFTFLGAPDRSLSVPCLCWSLVQLQQSFQDFTNPGLCPPAHSKTRTSFSKSWKLCFLTELYFLGFILVKEGSPARHRNRLAGTAARASGGEVSARTLRNKIQSRKLVNLEQRMSYSNKKEHSRFQDFKISNLLLAFLLFSFIVLYFSFQFLLIFPEGSL